MKKIKNYIRILSVLLFGCLIVSCSSNDDDGEEDYYSNRSKSKADEEAEYKLTRTSWNCYKSEPYDKSRKTKTTFTTSGTVTFTNYSQNPDFSDLIEPYQLHLIGVGSTGYDHYGQWEIINGILYIHPDFFIDESLAQMATLLDDVPSKSKIFSLTSKQLVLDEERSSGEGCLYYFTSTKYKEASNVPSSISEGNASNHNTGSGSQSESGEAPIVIDYQFTPTSTSISVRFVASDYPSMARIKMGKDMNNLNTFVSETITGKHVTGIAKNLKKGTKYYFKCLLKNKNGTSESAVYPAMTLSE